MPLDQSTQTTARDTVFSRDGHAHKEGTTSGNRQARLIISERTSIVMEKAGQWLRRQGSALPQIDPARAQASRCANPLEAFYNSIVDPPAPSAPGLWLFDNGIEG